MQVTFDEYKHITPSEISKYPGWTVISVLDGEDFISTQKQNRDQNGYNNYTTEYTVYKSPKLLIGKKNGDAIPALQTQIDILNEEIVHQKQLVSYKEDEIKNSKSDIKHLQEENARLHDWGQKYVEEYRLKYNVANESAKKLERDLSKVRQAIGDIKFREIVMEEKKND